MELLIILFYFLQSCMSSKRLKDHVEYTKSHSFEDNPQRDQSQTYNFTARIPSSEDNGMHTTATTSLQHTTQFNSKKDNDGDIPPLDDFNFLKTDPSANKQFHVSEELMSSICNKDTYLSNLDLTDIKTGIQPEDIDIDQEIDTVVDLETDICMSEGSNESLLLKSDEEDYLAKFVLPELSQKIQSGDIDFIEDENTSAPLEISANKSPISSFSTYNEKEHVSKISHKDPNQQIQGDDFSYEEILNEGPHLAADIDYDEVLDKLDFPITKISHKDPNQQIQGDDFNYEEILKEGSHLEADIDYDEVLKELDFAIPDEQVEFHGDNLTNDYQQVQPHDINNSLHSFKRQGEELPSLEVPQQINKKQKTMKLSTDTTNKNPADEVIQPDTNFNQHQDNVANNITHYHQTASISVSPQQPSTSGFVQTSTQKGKIKTVKENTKETCSAPKIYSIIESIESTNNIFSHTDLEQIVFILTGSRTIGKFIYQECVQKIGNIYNASTALFKTNIVILKNFCSFLQLNIDVSSYFKMTDSAKTFKDSLNKLKRDIKFKLSSIQFNIVDNTIPTTIIYIDKNVIKSEKVTINPHNYHLHYSKKFKRHDLIVELLYCLREKTNGKINNIIPLLFYFYQLDGVENNFYDELLAKIIIAIRIIHMKSEDRFIDDTKITKMLKDNVTTYFGYFYKKNGCSFSNGFKSWISSFKADCTVSEMSQEDDIFNILIYIVASPHLKKLSPFQFIFDILQVSKCEEEKKFYAALRDLLSDSISVLAQTNKFICDEMFLLAKKPKEKLIDIK